MPETPSTIELDIADLEKQLESKKAALEHDKSEKEILHGIIGEKIEKHEPAHEPLLAPSGSVHVTESPSYLSGELKDKIQDLINLVFSGSLEEGIKEATKSGNPALVKAFHDILVDELYEKLVALKKIDKVD